MSWIREVAVPWQLVMLLIVGVVTFTSWLAGWVSVLSWRMINIINRKLRSWKRTLGLLRYLILGSISALYRQSFKPRLIGENNLLYEQRPNQAKS